MLAKSSDRKRAEQYLAASGAVPITVIVRDGVCKIHNGKITGTVEGRWWVHAQEPRAWPRRPASSLASVRMYGANRRAAPLSEHPNLRARPTMSRPRYLDGLQSLTNWGARSQYERRLATLPVATQLRTRNRNRCRHPEQSHAGERESRNNERAPFAGPSCTFHCPRSCWFARRIGAGEPSTCDPIHNPNLFSGLRQTLGSERPPPLGVPGTA
jgi:hypothetical protein